MTFHRVLFHIRSVNVQRQSDRAMWTWMYSDRNVVCVEAFADFKCQVIITWSQGNVLIKLPHCQSSCHSLCLGISTSCRHEADCTPVISASFNRFVKKKIIIIKGHPRATEQVNSYTWKDRMFLYVSAQGCPKNMPYISDVSHGHCSSLSFFFFFSDQWEWRNQFKLWGEVVCSEWSEMKELDFGLLYCLKLCLHY